MLWKSISIHQEKQEAGRRSLNQIRNFPPQLTCVPWGPSPACWDCWSNSSVDFAAAETRHRFPPVIFCPLVFLRWYCCWLSSVAWWRPSFRKVLQRFRITANWAGRKWVWHALCGWIIRERNWKFSTPTNREGMKSQVHLFCGVFGVVHGWEKNEETSNCCSLLTFDFCLWFVLLKSRGATLYFLHLSLVLPTISLWSFSHFPEPRIVFPAARADDDEASGHLLSVCGTNRTNVRSLSKYSVPE